MKNNMDRKGLTWDDLANKINQMTPEEKKESVKVWLEDQPLYQNVFLEKEKVDICSDKEDPERMCGTRSDFVEGTELCVELKANTYYLDAD